MNLAYNTFVANTPTYSKVTDFIWASVQIFFSNYADKLKGKFDTAMDIYTLVAGKIRAIVNGSSIGDWTDIGKLFIDIADILVSLTGVGNAYTLAKTLWNIGSLA